MLRRACIALAVLSVASCSSERREEAYWTLQLGTTDEDYGTAVATDAAGNVFLAGTTYGFLDPAIPDPEWGGDPHAFVAKYDAAGALRWIRQLEAGWISRGQAVATDAEGSVLLAGTGSTLGVTAGCSDAFVVKYDAGGVRQWTRQLATPWCDQFTAVTTDTAGDVLLAGSTGAISTGDAPPGGGDGFVVKYGRDGTERWTRAVGGGWPYAVATDTAGNVLVAGTTGVGLGGAPTAGDYDAFVVKYDPDGAPQWTRQIGTVPPDYGTGIATDRSGNVFVGGATCGGLDGLPAPEYGWDPFLVKYDPEGTRLWTRMLGTWFYDQGHAVATDAADNAILVGTMRGSLDPYDGITLTRGDLTAFAVKYAPDGAQLWFAEIGRTSQLGNAVATDGGGNVFVAGTSGEGFDGNRGAGYHDAFVASRDAGGTKR